MATADKSRITIATAVAALVLCVPVIGWAYVVGDTASRAEAKACENDKRVDNIERGLIRIETLQEATIHSLDKLSSKIDKEHTP